MTRLCMARRAIATWAHGSVFVSEPSAIAQPSGIDWPRIGVVTGIAAGSAASRLVRKLPSRTTASRPPAPAISSGAVGHVAGVQSGGKVVAYPGSAVIL